MVEVRLEEGVGREKNDRALSGNELWLRTAPPVVAETASAEILGGIGREKNDRALSGNELWPEWPDRLRSGCEGMLIEAINVLCN